MTLMNTLQTLELATRIISRVERTATSLYRLGKEWRKRQFLTEKDVGAPQPSPAGQRRKDLIKALTDLSIGKEKAAALVDAALKENPEASDQDVLTYVLRRK